MDELTKLNLFKDAGFTYDPISGKLFGIRGREIKKKNNGYIQCSIAKYKILVYGHRLGWFLYYEELPPKEIDHIDRDKINNKIENLREVSHQQNLFNQKGKGYCYHKRHNKFKAQIKKDNKDIHLGYFDTKEEARQAYLSAKEIYHKI